MSELIFDIETVPDIELCREVLHLPAELSTEDVMTALRVEQGVTANKVWAPLACHQVVAISLVFAQGDTVKITSLGEEHSSEQELIEKFFAGIEHYQPMLVSWNGSGFDLPVLQYRALKYGVVSEHYWDVGDTDSRYRYNNYLNRYHYRHFDMMDVLSGYQQRAAMKLDTIAKMLKLPGKMSIDGSQVFSTYLQGGITQIRDYCELDVLNTYLIFLRLQYCRGKFTKNAYQQRMDVLKQKLQSEPHKAHWQAFLAEWEEGVASAVEPPVLI